MATPLQKEWGIIKAYHHMSKYHHFYTSNYLYSGLSCAAPYPIPWKRPPPTPTPHPMITRKYHNLLGFFLHMVFGEWNLLGDYFSCMEFQVPCSSPLLLLVGTSIPLRAKSSIYYYPRVLFNMLDTCKISAVGISLTEVEIWVCRSLGPCIPGGNVS